MLKLRLKRTGRKGSPSYRLVIMEHSTRRNGRPIDEVGYYNPITKQSSFDTIKITNWLKVGAKPTQTVFDLLRKSQIIEG
jgi:small subunit ribosomal protein S16